MSRRIAGLLNAAMNWALALPPIALVATAAYVYVAVAWQLL
ncbi:hypothetical protein [Frankia sp. Cj3]|nr:hypothetical protein [Frankia sp. Cj3]